jgi:putative flippase GtrA
MNQAGFLQPGKMRHLGYEFSKYFLVSLVALACDFSVLILLSKYVHYALAAVVGFLTGTVVHYGSSVLFVFSNRKLQAKKLAEWGVFVCTGLAGLLVNVGVISFCVEFFSMPLPFAKTVAAGFSFLFGYLIRKLVLF